MVKKHSSAVSLIEYLDQASLDADFNLSSNGLLSFHWSNWGGSCAYMKNQMRKCEDLSLKNNRIKDLNNCLDELKNKPIWLKNRQRCLETTFYNLYENYLDPRIRGTWFDREEEILISTHTQSGPYITLSSMRWIDKKVYTSFVRRKMLTDFVPNRSLRLNLEIPIAIYFNHSPLNKGEVILHQATEKGITLKFNHSVEMTKALNSKSLKLSLNINPFIEMGNRPYPEMIQHFSQFKKEDFKKNLTDIVLNTDIFSKYGNKNNIRSSDGKEFFIFLQYSDLIGLSDHFKMDKFFHGLIGELEKQFMKEILDKSGKNVAA